MCFTPFPCRNSANSAEVNCGPLSDTSYRDNPKVANTCWSNVMVFCDVVLDCISCTSGHLECASTITR